MLQPKRKYNLKHIKNDQDIPSEKKVIVLSLAGLVARIRRDPKETEADENAGQLLGCWGGHELRDLKKMGSLLNELWCKSYMRFGRFFIFGNRAT